MLGKQVAGSPWSNARHLQKDQTAAAVSSQAERKHINAKKDTKYIKIYMENWRKIGRKNMYQEPFGTRCAESQIQVCCWRIAARQIAKNAENPLSAHLSLQGLCSEPRDEESIKQQ